jgi:hypothetical protein
MLNQNGMLDCSCLASTQEATTTDVNWKQEIWFFSKIKCHLTKGSKPFCIYWLQQRHVISDQSCSGNIKKWTVFVL